MQNIEDIISDVIFCNFIRNVLNYKIYHVSDAIVYHKLQKSQQFFEKNQKTDDMIFIKNRWFQSQRKKLGYKEPIWDLSKDELEGKNFKKIN